MSGEEVMGDESKGYQYGCSSPLLSTVLLSAVSFTHGQLWSKNIKWKVTEISSS